VQGVIDALVETAEGLWLVDYKSDVINPNEVAARAKAYEPQMALYGQAIESIYGKPPAGAVLVFLSANSEFAYNVEELAAWTPAKMAQ